MHFMNQGIGEISLDFSRVVPMAWNTLGISGTQ